MSDWKCGAARDLPINTQMSWDGSAAEKSIWDWAGFGGDSPDPAKARRAFLAYDAADAEKKGSYKLPFAQVLDGKLTAIIAGCRAAASRLPQTDGLPDSVQTAARAVLDGYFARVDKALSVPSSRFAGVVFSHPAAVSQRATTTDLLALAKGKQAMDSTVFDEHPPFFMQAEISNNRLDAYFSRMHESSLRNYAADAQGGVSVLNSHNSRQLGFGRSLSGQYVGPGGNGVARVLSDFYTIPGLNLNGVNTDDLILGVRAGLVQDVSVGFYGGTWVCSICGMDLWDWDCPHIPGMEYAPVGKNGDRGTPELCIGWVHDAHLAEYSLVYDGATPGAGLLKAQQEAAGGRLRPEVTQVIEARYRVHLPLPARRWPGTDAEQVKGRAGDREDPMPDTETTAPHTPPQDAPRETPAPPPPADTPPRSAESDLTALRALLAESGLPSESDVVAAVRATLAEVARLRPLADDGRQYRVDLVAAALSEGVRAFGADHFAVEDYRGMLESATLAHIKRMRDDWAAIGDRQFAGGRQSVDGAPGAHTHETAGTRELPVPTAAYRG